MTVDARPVQLRDDASPTSVSRILARWRLAILLGRRDVLAHRVRTALVVLSVAIATAVVGFTASTVARVTTPGGSVTLTSDADLNTQVSVDDATVAILTAVGALALLQTVVLVAPAFLISLRRRTRELGVLAATGARPADIRRIVLGPAVVTATVGAAIGGVAALTLGLLVAPPTLREVAAVVPTVGAVVALNVLLCALVAWIPARRVLRESPTAALRAAPATAAPAPGRLLVWATLGVTLLAGGVPLAFAGARSQTVSAMVTGVVLAEAGLLGLVGAALGALGRVPLRNVATAYVLRDAARSRTRVLPAVAAAAVMIAGAVAALTYSATQHADEAARHMLVAPIGSALVLFDDTVESVDDVRTAAQALTDIRDVVPLTVAIGAEDFTRVEVGPAGPASVDAEGSALTMYGPLVGTPELVTALGLGASAVDAVGDGSALVPARHVVAADGTVELRSQGRSTTVSATVVPALWRYAPVVLPQAVAEGLGLTATTVGALVIPEQRFGAGDVAQVQEALNGQVELGGPRFADDGTDYALIAAGALAVLLVTWAMTALAAHEARSDLATLEAVGASPRTRRRLAGTQAGLVAAAGSLCGVPAGLALGWLFLTAQRNQAYLETDPLTALAVPPGPIIAVLVGLPIVVGVAGALTARTTTTLTRRVE